MVAASWGMELMSGSGVLLGGEMASGVITIRGLSCRRRSLCMPAFIFQAYHLFTKSCVWSGDGGTIGIKPNLYKVVVLVVVVQMMHFVCVYE